MARTAPTLTREMMVPFALVTLLFALWGFANDITNPMVAAFKNILLISHFESSLVQFAFYGGYCFMAFPAAFFIQRFSYRAGILLGLALYAAGCLLFIPSGYLGAFPAFLAAYFVMTCGLSFLETSANPYILSMGDPRTATRRLNLAQAFNPVGSLAGMLVAREWILARLNSTGEEERRAMQASDPEAFAAIRDADLAVIVGPYATLGVAVVLVLGVFALARLPVRVRDHTLEIGATFRRLLANRNYVEGVVAQAFYVGAQIMCWTFIIQYGVAEVGLSKEEAQTYNMAAMGLFVASRFICTYLLGFFRPGLLLLVLGLAGAGCLGVTILVGGQAGLYGLVGASGCMSLMFPTIYGLALHGVGEDAKLGSAGLIFAIGGGCLMPPMQGALMDGSALVLGHMALSAVRYSFILPVVCFLVVALFGWRSGFRAGFR
ncbi:MAG: L-fucose:H+ symporter permease [Verrucomicrobiia bacterium]